MPRPNNASLDDLLIQLKTVNRLLAAQLRSRLNQTEMVKLLATTGLSVRELAEILDTTPATVAVTLQRVKKKGRSPRTSPAE